MDLADIVVIYEIAKRELIEKPDEKPQHENLGRHEYIFAPRLADRT
jgi:hypothetical protein